MCLSLYWTNYPEGNFLTSILGDGVTEACIYIHLFHCSLYLKKHLCSFHMLSEKYTVPREQNVVVNIQKG